MSSTNVNTNTRTNTNNNELDKIEDLLKLTNPLEMDSLIYQNTITITKILKSFSNKLCENFQITKEECEIFIYCLKFIDTMNLFIPDQIIENLLKIVYSINEIVSMVNNLDWKELILKKIKYTEMTVIYYKKRYFWNLYFSDGEFLVREVENSLDLVTRNGGFNQRLFKQMQNIFYVVQGKIDERRRKDIQSKLNEMKNTCMKAKKNRFTGIYDEDYDDYTDYKNAEGSNVEDYYDHFNFNPGLVSIGLDNNSNFNNYNNVNRNMISLMQYKYLMSLKNKGLYVENLDNLDNIINNDNALNKPKPNPYYSNTNHNTQNQFYIQNYKKNFNYYGLNNNPADRFTPVKNKEHNNKSRTMSTEEKYTGSGNKDENLQNNRSMSNSQPETSNQVNPNEERKNENAEVEALSPEFINNKNPNDNNDNMNAEFNKINRQFEVISVPANHRKNTHHSYYKRTNEHDYKYNSNKHYKQNNFTKGYKLEELNQTQIHAYVNNNLQKQNVVPHYYQNVNYKYSQNKQSYKYYNNRYSNLSNQFKLVDYDEYLNRNVSEKEKQLEDKEDKTDEYEGLKADEICKARGEKEEIIQNKEENEPKNEDDEIEIDDLMDHDLEKEHIHEVEANDSDNLSEEDEDEEELDQEESEIMNKEFDQLINESNLTAVNKDYEEVGENTKNNKVIFADDRKQQEVGTLEKEHNNIQEITPENKENLNPNIISITSSSENIRDKTKGFMDSLKSIDPKVLNEIKNKLNERAVDKLENLENPKNYNNSLEFTAQGMYSPQYPFLMNSKIPLQNYIFANYSNFFYIGRDANIHREYFALKCLEQENSPIITNNKKEFEKRILIPLYQRINFSVNQKKGIYYNTFSKYKKLIYQVLGRDKVLKKVKPYGSYMNNFLIDSGDIDICIVPKCGILQFSPYLERLKEAILSQGIGEHRLTHQNSRYMLLKVIDNQSKYVIDITVHNMLPILNTNLIRLYSLFDQRFHIIGLYLKHWAKINKVHGAADSYLSSYALLLMLIYFLQNVIEPKVLPNLQRIETKEIIYEYPINSEMIKTNIYFEEDVKKIRAYMNSMNNGKDNRDSASELLVKFFEYYSYYYDYYDQKISIHRPLEDCFKKTQDSIAFSIDDPFDPHHNPGKSMIIDSNQFHKFITCMKKEINLILNGEYLKRLDKMCT